MCCSRMHFYQPYQPGIKGRKVEVPDGMRSPGTPKTWVRRYVGREAMPDAVFCEQCAQEKGTLPVICYQRTIGVGEPVGVDDPLLREAMPDAVEQSAEKEKGNVW